MRTFSLFDAPLADVFGRAPWRRLGPFWEFPECRAGRDSQQAPSWRPGPVKAPPPRTSAPWAPTSTSCPAWLFDLHRFIGGLAVAFTVVHVLAVIADSYVDFSLVNVLVPLTGDWHPLAVAWGIVGLYLLLAVELTSLAMARLPRRLWRRVHMASFLVFATTSVHALTAGTDRRSVPFLVAVALACGAVALLGAVRVWKALPAHPRQRDVSVV